MATLLTQLDLLSRNIMELEVPCQKKDRNIPSRECRKSKDYESGQVGEILSLILHKNEEYENVMKKIKENVSLLN